MRDPAAQLRAQIRSLQAERRSLESQLLQPQSMLPASLIERFLRPGGSPRTAPAHYLSRSEHGRSKLTYVKKAEAETVAAPHRIPATALEAVAAGPVPLKHFCPSLSIFLDFGSLVCHKQNG